MSKNPRRTTTMLEKLEISQNDLRMARDAIVTKAREASTIRDQAEKVIAKRDRQIAEMHQEINKLQFKIADLQQTVDVADGNARRADNALLDLETKITRLNGYIDRVREIDRLRANLLRPGHTKPVPEEVVID